MNRTGPNTERSPSSKWLNALVISCLGGDLNGCDFSESVSVLNPETPMLEHGPSPYNSGQRFYYIAWLEP